MAGQATKPNPWYLSWECDLISLLTNWTFKDSSLIVNRWPTKASHPARRIVMDLKNVHILFVDLTIFQAGQPVDPKAMHWPDGQQEVTQGCQRS